MIKKFTLLLLAMLSIAGISKASEYDLDISQLSGSTYNSSTHVFDFGTLWAENQWWIGTDSPLDISSYGEFIVEYTGATSASKYRVYLEPVDGTTQTVYVTASQTIGRNVIKLTSELNSIKKIVISDAGTAFQMTLKRAYFRSKSNASKTILWEGNISLGGWKDITDLKEDGDGKNALKGAKVDDVIRVTFSDANTDNQVNFRNSDYNDFLDGTFSDFIVKSEEQIVDYVIPNAEVLESIQLNGIMISGKNVTVKEIALITYDESYNAAYITIGPERIRTYSTQDKILDFSGTEIIPYYAYKNDITSGVVKLTLTDETTPVLWSYSGAILCGDEGKYEIPVYNRSNESDYTGCPQYIDDVNQNCLKGGGDYSQDVARSVEGKYHYIFAKHGEEIGFYLLGTDYSEGGKTYHTLAAHKAYLETETDYTPKDLSASPKFAGSRSYMRLSFGGGGGTTAINTALKNPIVEDGIYYTLQGVAVKNPSKGIYILNGKKVFVK